jgi:DNA-cytosine methyltransferase
MGVENVKKSMNIVSLFDGCSGAQASLNKIHARVDNYYASEVDSYAIKIAQKNYPNTIQMGDVKGVSIDRTFPNIDLLIGGSPCQDLSFAGHQKGLVSGTRSNLFFEYVRILKELKEINPDIKFLLENVRMKQENQNIISDLLGVEPILINSAKLSAQNRQRLYWTNIEGVRQPNGSNLVLKDILESDVDLKYLAGERLLKNYKGGNQLNPTYKSQANTIHDIDIKGPALCAGTHGYAIGYVPSFSKDGLCHVGDADIKGIDSLKRVYHAEGKAPTLTTMQGGHRQPKIFQEPYNWRKLTPLECERLQGFPDNYTEGVSNTQRYKMLGNGFQVDTISFILDHII